MKKHKVVFFGGGTGLSTLLSGLSGNKKLDISAIVTMFDSGGSSGVLRDTLGVLPPSDIFRCTLALSPRKYYEANRSFFSQRLLGGHTPGNIFLVGAGAAYSDYQTAINELGHAFSAQGRVYPVSVEESSLCAEFTDGSSAQNEVGIDMGIMAGKDIRQLFLNPEVELNKDAIGAICNADLMCLGPGSFYTSILSNLLPKGMYEVIEKSKAPIIYIANLMTEGLGMQNYNIWQYIKIMKKYLSRYPDAVIINQKIPHNVPNVYWKKEKKIPILWERKTLKEGDDIIMSGNIWTDGSLARHNPKKLASLFLRAVDRLLC